MDRPSETVGFIDLGQMGGGIANNLLLAGIDLIAYHQHQETTNKYVQLGARIAKSPAILAIQVKNHFFAFRSHLKLQLCYLATMVFPKGPKKAW